MASWGVFESYRREAEKLKAKREVTPQVTKTVSALAQWSGSPNTAKPR